MKSEPKVSICIPTFNRLDYLKQAIKSCFDQSYKDFEIIITDNSNNLITEEYINSLGDQRIRYFRNERNLGFTRNFNLAISMTRGKYIKVLMDDDLMVSSALEEMVRILDDKPEVGVIMSPMNVINPKGESDYYRAYLIKKIKVLYRYQHGSGVIAKEKILHDFLTKCYPCCVPSALMYRQECFQALGELDLSMKFATDVEICMRFAKKFNFYYLDKTLTSWRYSDSSLTVNLHQSGNDVEEFYYLTEKFLSDPDVKNSFCSEDWMQLKIDSYMFATKRCFLSIIAGIQARNLKIVKNTIALIFRRDPYARRNLLRLIPNFFREITSAAISWLR